jgi:predicted RNA-binding protein with PUA-like domain
MQQYWLLKSEPSVFSIDHLSDLPNQTDGWEGVRNYQARNFLRDDMALGDLAFFYHSNCSVPGIVGIVEIVTTAHPDITAWDPSSTYFDPKSTPEQPRWYSVKVQLKQKFNHLIPLSQLKSQPALKECALVKKGNRLSVMPLTPSQWQCILQLATP